ncbi:hypothetical protein RN001_014058 [Aquatica leii]|uniref:Uncharacterized protein n=1 Tax=Aquatica leii TaxID=1421715 RepID=A0AAN7QDM8_9COLE|nr:hypothetical protein RN001_014058 [Aquatica leii]
MNLDGNLSPKNVSISINLDDTNNKIDDVNVADVAVVVAMDAVNILPIVLFNSTDSGHVPNMQIDPSFELHETYNITQQISAVEIPQDPLDLPLNESLSERHNVTENIPQEKIPNDHTPPQTFNNVVVHKTPDKMSQESLDGVTETSHLTPTIPTFPTPVDQGENCKKKEKLLSAISCKAWRNYYKRKYEEKKKTRKCAEEKGTENCSRILCKKQQNVKE